MDALHFWRDIALIVLGVEAILAGIVPLVLFFLGIRGLRWTERQVHHYVPLARRRWRTIHTYVARWGNWVRYPLRFREPYLDLEKEAHR